MHRALCPVEALYVGQRSRAVLSCTLRGPVDVAALSAAFDALTEANPTLRTRIVQEGTGHVLRLLDEDERPRLATRTGSVEEAYTEELNRPLPVGGPLSRAVLVSAPDGESHLFVLVVDHTVTDGHSSIALHNALWDRYRSLVDGERPAATGDAGPRPGPYPSAGCSRPPTRPTRRSTWRAAWPRRSCTRSSWCRTTCGAPPAPPTGQPEPTGTSRSAG